MFLYQKRPRTYKEEVLLDNNPQQDTWKSIMNFSTYPAVYTQINYQQEYSEQSICELDIQYSILAVSQIIL